MTTKRKIGISVGVALLLTAGILFFYVFDPETHSFFPRCPFLVATGYECPGCGSQRAIHRLLHADFRGAFAQNALMLFLVPYFLVGIYLAFGGGRKKCPRLEKILFGKRGAIGIVLFILVFWVWRNLF